MINISNLYLQFNGTPVIKNLNLTVEDGERIAVIGPSGCGKSTLLRLIIGLHQADSGSIQIDGEEITKASPKELKNIRLKFGMLFQSSALFDSMSVEENVAFSLSENFNLLLKTIKKKVEEKLKLVGMENTEAMMPADLSGGMKKRIGLARAIFADPQIMLYDEPTTGLDPIRSTHIENLIVKLADQMKVTSIVVTHQHSTILRTADKIYCMHDGALLPPESPEGILHSKNPYIQRFIKGDLENGDHPIFSLVNASFE